ncbi:MAG: four helix bundle protein [Nitrospirae bacterium]|nr:four helix bundle protein [Nitrospirota bacterium]
MASELLLPFAMGFLFEKLEVYQRAVSWAETIETLCETVAKGNYPLANQLRRAALSISLNIAEGSGRWHPKDKKQFYLIARGSAYECVPILDLLHRKKLIDDPVYENFKNEVDVIARMLTKLVQNVEK